MNKYTEDSINTERIYYMVKGGEIYECKIKQLVFKIPNPISVNYFFTIKRRKTLLVSQYICIIKSHIEHGRIQYY